MFISRLQTQPILHCDQLLARSWFNALPYLAHALIRCGLRPEREHALNNQSLQYIWDLSIVKVQRRYFAYPDFKYAQYGPSSRMYNIIIKYELYTWDFSRLFSSFNLSISHFCSTFSFLRLLLEDCRMKQLHYM